MEDKEASENVLTSASIMKKRGSKTMKFAHFADFYDEETPKTKKKL